ncbi:polyribonucleotide nucleotidyltransferase [Candidatus Woesebacteria bacterium]|nr:polyribonucleotide nucleotidyltransferase [Candidatus Woesebacteria bacterium]MCD8507141.1 polyribonucleotide nucleotidyltransferase [Candidatus Woesebacteria bacterium]
MSIHTQTIRVGNKDIQLTVGRFSEQADAAVLAQCGSTVVHATVAVGRESGLDFFPLTVEYQENLYAGGRIKGSRWVKRPGRPSDDAILSARVIDRSIRPLFPDGMRREVQVVASVLSVDHENNPDTLAMIASMAALEISSIPFAGPVSGVRIGYNPDADSFIFNPTYEEQSSSVLDLILAGTKEAIVMVEAGAIEVDEETMVRAFEAGSQVLADISAELSKLRDAVGKEKFAFESPELDADLLKEFSKSYHDQIHEAVVEKAHLRKSSVISEIIAKLREEREDLLDAPLEDIFSKLQKKEARRMIIEDGERPDGRTTEEVRQITSEVGVLPMVHGSGLFKRGATQVLSVATLGSPALAQLIEDMEGEEERRYIHHYNMPPFASGETGRIGSPKRREIGHGALAERALLPVLPTQEEFPYTIHVVSEVMSSNGSTSQASVCGSTLALMDAGVPIRKPVSGIAMGLMKEGDKTVVLTDIQGLEDHVGDMDFKVAGTRDGITALQMDIKISGITLEILRTALAQAKVARMHIMDVMMEAISEPRADVAENAPKIESVQIPVDKIGTVIGPGGKVIKQIQEDLEVEVNIDDSGMVSIAGIDRANITKAVKFIKDLTLELSEGMEFDGTVARIEDYGAFVDLVPGKTGLVHVSEMGTGFVDDPRNVVELNETVHVWVKQLEGDRIRLSMVSPEEWSKESDNDGEGGERRSRGGNRGGGRDRGGRNDRRGGGRDRGGDRRGGSRGRGPRRDS